MLPLSIIGGKVCPCFDCSVFVHYCYDEVEFVNDVFVVRVKYTSTLSLVVAPCGEKFGGKMVVRVECQFSNKG